MSNLSITQLRQSLSGLDEKFFDKYGAHSISVGLKEVGGELTKKVCIRFAVEKKLSSEQLDTSTKIEKIPANLGRLGINVDTDVVQQDAVKIGGAFGDDPLNIKDEYSQPFEEDNINQSGLLNYMGAYDFGSSPDNADFSVKFDKLEYRVQDGDNILDTDYLHEPTMDDTVVQKHRVKSRPLSGGISSITSLVNSTATLGLVVQDKQDKQPVLLSNNHVYGNSQFVGIEGIAFSDYSNTFLLSARQPGWADVYQTPGIDAPNAFLQDQHVGFVKRVVPFRTNGMNFVDAAISSISGMNNITDHKGEGLGSCNILHLGQNGPYEFASTEEIDSLLDVNSVNYAAPIFRSGRTLGPIGYGNANQAGSTESSILNRRLSYNFGYAPLSSDSLGNDLEKLGTERITEAKYLNNVLVRPAIGFGDSLKIETDQNHVYIGGYQKGSSIFNYINKVTDSKMYPGAVDFKTAGDFTKLPGTFVGKNKVVPGNAMSFACYGTDTDAEIGYYGAGALPDRQLRFISGSLAGTSLHSLVPHISTNLSDAYQPFPMPIDLIKPKSSTHKKGEYADYDTDDPEGLPCIHVRANVFSPNNIISVFTGDYSAGTINEMTDFWGRSDTYTKNANSATSPGGWYPPKVVYDIDKALSGDYFKVSDNMYVKAPSAGTPGGVDFNNQPFFYRYLPGQDQAIDFTRDADGNFSSAAYRAGWSFFMHTPINVPSNDEPSPAAPRGGAFRSFNLDRGLSTDTMAMASSGWLHKNPHWVGTSTDNRLYFNLSQVNTSLNTVDSVLNHEIITRSSGVREDAAALRWTGAATPGLANAEKTAFNHDHVPLSAGGPGFCLDITPHGNYSATKAPGRDGIKGSEIKIIGGGYYHEPDVGKMTILSGQKLYSIGVQNPFGTLGLPDKNDKASRSNRGQHCRFWTEIDGNWKDAYLYGIGSIFAIDNSTNKVHHAASHNLSAATNATNTMSSVVDDANDLANNVINYLGEYNKLYIESEQFSWFYGQRPTSDNHAITWIFARGGWQPITIAKHELGTAFTQLSVFDSNTEMGNSFKHGLNHIINENGKIWYSTVLGQSEKSLNQAIESTTTMFYSPLKNFANRGTSGWTCYEMHDNIDKCDAHAHTIDFETFKFYGKTSAVFLSGDGTADRQWLRTGKNLDNSFMKLSAYHDDMIVTDLSLNVRVGGIIGGEVTTFRDCIAIRSKHKHFPVTQGGDSGSAVLALFNRDTTPTWKVIGLVFAGPRPTNAARGIVCRIDRIADQLNVEPWDGVLPTETSKTQNIFHDTELQTPMSIVLSGRNFSNVGGRAPSPNEASVFS